METENNKENLSRYVSISAFLEEVCLKLRETIRASASSQEHIDVSERMLAPMVLPRLLKGYLKEFSPKMKEELLKQAVWYLTEDYPESYNGDNIPVMEHSHCYNVITGLLETSSQFMLENGVSLENVINTHEHLTESIHQHVKRKKNENTVSESSK